MIFNMILFSPTWQSLWNWYYDISQRKLLWSHDCISSLSFSKLSITDAETIIEELNAQFFNSGVELTRSCVVPSRALCDFRRYALLRILKETYGCSRSEGDYYYNHRQWSTRQRERRAFAFILGEVGDWYVCYRLDASFLDRYMKKRF